MFLQWCRDELVLSFIFVQRLVSWDRTRLRKGTTAETQTLAVILSTTSHKYEMYRQNNFEPFIFKPAIVLAFPIKNSSAPKISLNTNE